ncbi:DNA primase [Rubricella aquisinus]|uniref:DNA primase n=1 Tax=Rubricella aquisinus TaxID=2028108 RepID=A0A840WJR4_9RHOB|nr:DNA primase [Rubricella aquisinus]MBB5515338.1 DNA primase [Rubricella aquisinus]
MSLPPGFLDELRDRVSLSAIAGRKVTWDMKKTNQAKGDWWAPCPFHQEKSASFHVDDKKGFYYCFGCQAKGNVYGFVQETENLSFMEAVEMLCREAGMEMPARDPRAAKEAEKRASLWDVMEAAVRHFRTNLNGARARAARDYIDGRGLSADTVARFEIGFAPDGRTDLLDHLKAKGFDQAQIVEAGLAIQPDDGGSPYDRFRGRIMFPIRDARGKCISFGGRAMDPNARAKYLNGPATPLFDKSRALYNIGPAREAAGKAQALIVAEGYMDVIALAQAGFSHAVAPLGTAVTADQLRMLWRVVDEPVIALDGDAAGLRAARKVVDTALPLLEPGRSLRFLILPEGQDPDDLIRAQGPQAMAALLEETRAMVDILWEREIEGKNFDSPERRAALDASLRKAIGRITDPSIRRHYGEAIRERRQLLFGGNRPQQAENRWQPARVNRRAQEVMPAASTRASLLAQSADDPASRARIRESAILYVCLNHPSLAMEHEDALERLGFACDDLGKMRDVLLSCLAEHLGDADLAGEVSARLGFDCIEKLTAIGHVRSHPHLGPGANPDHAAQALREEIARQTAIQGMTSELRDVAEEPADEEDDRTEWRLREAVAARDTGLRGIGQDDARVIGDETDLADLLSSFVKDEIWVKKR